MRGFHENWFCIGRREQLTAPGSFFVENVAGDSLIVTLDDGNNPRALFNTCTHRGTQLTPASNGNFPKRRIICPYHRWVFGCDGRPLRAPNMQHRDDFNLEEWPLHQGVICGWEGFLLVGVGGQPGPVEAITHAVSRQVRPWRLSELTVARREQKRYECGWKSVLTDLKGDRRGPVHTELVPNLLLLPGDQHVETHRLVPLDSRQTVVVSEWLGE